VVINDAVAGFNAASVEAGEEVVITRRGVAIARIAPEPAGPADRFELQELFQFTNAQPMHAGPDAGAFLAELLVAIESADLDAAAGGQELGVAVELIEA